MSGIGKYLKSAVFPQDYPAADRPEVAIAGRSNAGKSSLLNTICGSSVAKVSQSPGKTRLLNFFDFGQHYRWVDMPGYGFASRSGDEMHEWHTMIETYLTTRETISGLLLVMDARRDWTEDEELLKRFCFRMERPMAIALTKIDKLKKPEITARVKEIKKQAGLSAIFPISNLKKQGVKELEEYIFLEWVKKS